MDILLILKTLALVLDSFDNKPHVAGFTLSPMERLEIRSQLRERIENWGKDEATP